MVPVPFQRWRVRFDYPDGTGGVVVLSSPSEVNRESLVLLGRGASVTVYWVDRPGARAVAVAQAAPDRFRLLADDGSSMLSEP